MRWSPWLAVLLSLSSCFLRHRGEDDPCQVPPAGECKGTLAGAEISGPLDPSSGWVPLRGQESAACGEDGDVLLLSCAGQVFMVRAAFPDADGDTPACGWSTDAPKEAPKMVSATLHQDEEVEWRTHGTVDATFADGSRVTIRYDLVDDTVCVAIPEPRKDNPIYKGIAFAVSVPVKALSAPGHDGHAGHHSHGAGHHHHHHHH